MQEVKQEESIWMIRPTEAGISNENKMDKKAKQISKNQLILLKEIKRMTIALGSMTLAEVETLRFSVLPIAKDGPQSLPVESAH